MSDSGVVPVEVEGNPTCSDLRPGLIELKVDPPTSGAYSDGYLSLNVTINNDTDKSVDWTSNVGIDIVVVKGGPSGNAYVYDLPGDPNTESFGDGGLLSPDNGSEGPAGVSHVSFCYDIELQVAKTADTTFTRAWSWDITKSVSPSVLDMFEGESGTVNWTVAVTKTGYVDSAWAVSGLISITNPSPTTAATVTGVTDSISGFGSVAPSCGVTFPYSLAAGATLNCTYSTPLPDGAARVNTATVTTEGVIGGGSDTADVLFGEPTTVVNGTINVTDTNGMAWSTDESTAWPYPQTFTCDGDQGQHANTATITETGQSASATATVNCYDLVVTKDALTSYTSTWDWTIVKTADQTDVTLMPGQAFPVNYTVTVSATQVDSNFKVFSDEGIKVHNPAPVAVDLLGVADVVSPGIPATVDCGVTFPYTLAAGGTLVCSYVGDLPNANSRNNTATATTEFGVSYAGTAPVDFGEAIVTEVDRCVDLTDSKYAGLAQTICADDDEFAVQLTYTLPISYEECGEYQVANTATIVTNTTETTKDSSWVVNVDVPCETGCTLTQGYWKTHSKYGPAPSDPDWYSIGDVDADGISEGPDETFFTSGKTWYQAFWTAPAGNPYYVLAHQYMAAMLNIANGASSTPAVNTALASATTFFTNNTPAIGAALKGASKNAILALAYTLDSYNNGVTGPGHCSE
jgi:hypothetical protein